jgi:hypothetical protein
MWTYSTITDPCRAGFHGDCDLLVNSPGNQPQRCFCLCHTQPFIDAARKHARDRLLFSRSTSSAPREPVPQSSGGIETTGSSVEPAGPVSTATWLSGWNDEVDLENGGASS